MLGGSITFNKIKIKAKSQENLSILDYVLSGCPMPPPPIIKALTIAGYQALAKCRFFIETGTYRAVTTTAVAPLFEQCFTIELSESLHQYSKRRLSKFKNVHALRGSSVEHLSDLLNVFQSPGLIWLDAHHSGGETSGRDEDPLKSELQSLLEHREKGHMILIDDARGLGATYEELKQIIFEFGPNYQASVCNDILRIVPTTFPMIGIPFEFAKSQFGC